MHPHVHLVQGLLHASDPVAPLSDQHGFVADEGPQHADLLDGAKRAPEQATTVQPLDPFAVATIGLFAARHAPQFPRVHEHDLQAVAFEHLVQGRAEQDVLYELLLKLGLDLCVPIETQTIAGKIVHSIGGGSRKFLSLANGPSAAGSRAIDAGAAVTGSPATIR